MLVFVFFSFVLSPCFSADEANIEPVPYSEDEFPQWTKDLRRAEIISLGAVPFAALGITIGYGTYLYKTGETEHFPNPFSKGDDSFTEEQQLKILGASLGAGLCIGVIDFTVACVPTGINTGVCMSPCGVCITPLLAPVCLHSCNNSYVIAGFACIKSSPSKRDAPFSKKLAKRDTPLIFFIYYLIYFISTNS